MNYYVIKHPLCYCLIFNTDWWISAKKEKKINQHLNVTISNLQKKSAYVNSLAHQACMRHFLLPFPAAWAGWNWGGGRRQKGRLTGSVAKSNQTIRSMVRPGSLQADVGSWPQQGMSTGQAASHSTDPCSQSKWGMPTTPWAGPETLQPNIQKGVLSYTCRLILIYSFSCSLGRIMKTITSSFGSTGDKYLGKKLMPATKEAQENFVIHWKSHIK